MEVNLIKL